MAALVESVGTPLPLRRSPTDEFLCHAVSEKSLRVPENFLRTQVISHRLQIPSEWFNFVKGYSTL